MTTPIAPPASRFVQVRAGAALKPDPSPRMTGATAEGLVLRWQDSHNHVPVRKSRDRRIRSQNHEPDALVDSSSVNLCDHATRGLQTTWSTNTIMPSIA